MFGNSQPAAGNLASNPFFNMAAPPMVQPTLGYPPVAQVCVADGILLNLGLQL